MSNKVWIIFAAACVVLLGSLIVLSNKNKLDVSGVDTRAIIAASVDNGNIADHVFGNAKSKVVLVEYGDYQCPGCGSAYPVIKSVTEKYADQLGFVFRNLPLTSMHPNARVAAAAAEAAGLQGKFWQMHDALYSNQAAWENQSVENRVDTLATYATTLGLDVTKFRADLENLDISKKISFDQALASKDKITGTPTFILNGKVVDQYVKDGKIVPANTQGANPIWSDADSFEKLLIIPALKEAGIALPVEKTETK